MATKSYTDELAAWIKKRPATKNPRQDLAAVAFLAVKSDVQAAIAAGYSLATIWEHMHDTGKVEFSYETFRKRVARHIRNPPAAQAAAPAPSAGVADLKPVKKTEGKKPPTPAPAGIPTFVYDASSTTSKDLL